MKDEEKDKERGTEASGEPVEGPKKLDRSTFLKAVGVGIGAVGLDMAIAGQLSARTSSELDSSRSGIQKLMRGLLEKPLRAKDFLNSPQAVAEEFGVRLTEDDTKKIQEALMKLTAELGDRIALTPGHQDWTHNDGTWHDTYNKTVTPKTGKPPKTTAPKAPSGVQRQRKQN